MLVQAGCGQEQKRCMCTHLFTAKCMTSVADMFMFTDALAFPSVVGFSK